MLFPNNPPPHHVSVPISSENFLEKFKEVLSKGVTNTAPILDALLSCNVISKETYDGIQSIPDSGKMDELFCGPLQSIGIEEKKILMNILEACEPDLMSHLRIKEFEKTRTVSKSLVL